MTDLEARLASLTARADQSVKAQQDGRAALRHLSHLQRDLGKLTSEALEAGDFQTANSAYRLRRRVRGAAGLPTAPPSP